MKTIVSTSLFYIGLLISMLFVSCSENEIERSVESKEDLIGYWSIDSYTLTQTKGDSILNEQTIELAGRLLLKEDGSACYMNQDFDWSERHDGFFLYKNADTSYYFKVSAVSYANMKANCYHTIKDKHTNTTVKEKIQLSLRRLPNEDTSLNPDNALLVGSWRAFYVVDMMGFTFNQEVIYEFSPNGNYSVTYVSGDFAPYTSTGTFDYHAKENKLITTLDGGTVLEMSLKLSDHLFLLDDGMYGEQEFLEKSEANSDNARLVGKWRYYTEMNFGEGMIMTLEMIYEFSAYGTFTNTMKMTGSDDIITSGKFNYNSTEGSFVSIIAGQEYPMKATLIDNVLTLESDGMIYDYHKIEEND